LEQNLIRLVDFDKLFMATAIAAIDIWMVASGQFSVRAFQIRQCGSRAQSQQLIAFSNVHSLDRCRMSLPKFCHFSSIPDPSSTLEGVWIFRFLDFRFLDFRF
jgi:hypothetical protein